MTVMLIIFCSVTKNTKNGQEERPEANRQRTVILLFALLIVSRCVGRCERLYDFFDAFFEFGPGHHDLVSASKAFDPEVGAGSHYFPFFAPARMRFAEFNYISKTVPVRHLHTPPIQKAISNF